MAYFYTNDHVRIYFEDSANQTGQPFIMIHGYGGNHAEFMHQQNYFNAQGYRVIVYDQRNHGESARTYQGLRVSRLAADLNDLIDYLQLKDVLVMGHSMGAAVVWAYLDAYTSQKIDQIITIDQSPKALNDGTWSYGLMDDDLTNISVTLRRIEQVKMTVQYLPDDTYHAIRAIQANYPFNYDQNEPLLLNHLIQDWRDIIQQYAAVDQLFIAGGKSPLWSCHYVTACQKLSGEHAQTAIVSDVGHLPHAEKPDCVNQIVDTFISN